MHQELDFRYDTLSRWWPWRHFTRQSATTWQTVCHAVSAQCMCSNAYQFLIIYSTLYLLILCIIWDLCLNSSINLLFMTLLAWNDFGKWDSYCVCEWVLYILQNESHDQYLLVMLYCRAEMVWAFRSQWKGKGKAETFVRLSNSDPGKCILLSLC